MWRMFFNASSLTSLNLSNFNTSNVTRMDWMFNGVSSLTSFDVSHFDTSNVTHMDGMFANMSSLTSLNLSNFNTGNVRIMGTSNNFSSGMFEGMTSLTSLDLRSFNTMNVTNKGRLFRNTPNLTQVLVTQSTWRTTSVIITDMWLNSNINSVTFA